MARVRVKVATPGVYETRKGRVEITPERCRYWERKHAALRRDGIRFPAPWGHQLSALPADPMATDYDAFLRSRFNAGEVDTLEIDPSDGGTIAVLDCPGVEEKDGKLISVAKHPDTGDLVTCSIGEVSPAVGLTWQDGRGRIHKDILGHVALTPLPVQAGQTGFTALSTDAPLGGFYLATGAPTVDDPKKKPGEKPEAKPPVAGKPEGKPDAEPDEDIAPAATDPDAPPDSADDDIVDPLLDAGDDDGVQVGDVDPNAGAETDAVSRVLASLAGFGVTLPPGATTWAELGPQLDIALTALAGLKAQQAAQPQPQQPETRRQDPTVNPTPATMMSLLSTLPAGVQENYKQQFREQRKRRLDRIERFVKRSLPVAMANELRAEVTAVKLSLAPDGSLKPHEIDGRLDLIHKLLPGKDDPANLLSTAVPEPSPAAKPGDGEPKEDFHGIPLTKAEIAEIKRQARNA